DQEAKGDHEEHRARDDEDLEPAHVEDDETEDEARDDAEEGVERGDACGRRDTEVKGDVEHRVEVVALHEPRKVEHTRDAQGSPNAAVFNEVEGHERMRGPELPDDKDRNHADADDEGRDDAGALPLRLGLEATGEGERDEDE